MEIAEVVDPESYIEPPGSISHGICLLLGSIIHFYKCQRDE